MEEKRICYLIDKVKGSNEEEWTHLRSSRLCYTDAKTIEEEYDFEDFWQKIIDNDATGWNCYFRAFKTFFKKEKRIMTDYVLLFDKTFSKKMTGEKIQFKTVVVETPHASIKSIAEDLSHKDFIEYLKDNQIDKVVM